MHNSHVFGSLVRLQLCVYYAIIMLLAVALIVVLVI